MTAPTRRQLEVLASVHSSVVARGYPPTIRELAVFLGLSEGTNAIGDHLRALRRKGLLESDRMRSRGLRVTESGLRALGELPPWVCAPIVSERRCECGAAYFGESCPWCKTSRVGVSGELSPSPAQASGENHTTTCDVSGSIGRCVVSSRRSPPIGEPPQRANAVGGSNDTGGLVR